MNFKLLFHWHPVAISNTKCVERPPDPAVGNPQRSHNAPRKSERSPRNKWIISPERGFVALGGLLHLSFFFSSPSSPSTPHLIHIFKWLCRRTGSGSNDRACSNARRHPHLLDFRAADTRDDNRLSPLIFCSCRAALRLCSPRWARGGLSEWVM